MQGHGVVAGRRILVVEDEALIALDLAGLLEERGATVLGPASSVAEALSLIAASKIDCAVIDVSLGGGEQVWPVVDALEQLAVPFVFLTAYYEKDLPPRHRLRPIFQKPVSSGLLLDAIAALTAGRPTGEPFI